MMNRKEQNLRTFSNAGRPSKVKYAKGAALETTRVMFRVRLILQNIDVLKKFGKMG